MQICRDRYHFVRARVGITNGKPCEQLVLFHQVSHVSMRYMCLSFFLSFFLSSRLFVPLPLYRIIIIHSIYNVEV